MTDRYYVHCDCGAIQLEMAGTPKVRAFCHCEDCRVLLDVPFHSVTAWNAEDVSVVSGAQDVTEYRHPTLEMSKVFCRHCGETVYNTNRLGWRLVSQLMIRKCYENTLPKAFQSDRHLFYDRRIIDVHDSLPKR